MKTSLIFSALIAVSMTTVSCNKDYTNLSGNPAPEPEGPKEIVFTAGGPALEVQTRAVSEISAMSGFHAMATTGSAAAERQVWSLSVTGMGPLFQTGKYWPSTDPGYHFYASILEMSFTASGPTVTVDGRTDAICAYIENPTYNDNNQFTFEHIMGRVGTYELVSAASGYTISAITTKITNGVKTGTYNLRTGEWSNLSTAGNVAVNVGQNDYLLVPGDYTLEVTFTMTKGDYVATFTKHADLTLEPGKITNITARIVDDPAVHVQFSYTTKAWESKALTLNVE